MKHIQLLLFLFLAPVALQAQNAIKGHVVSREDGLPVIGATVSQVSQMSNTAITDTDGNFEISVPKGSELIVQCIGYRSATVTASPDMTITLEEDAQKLDELVVVGYTKERRADITGAISVVSVNDIKDSPSANVATALKGRVAGLTIDTNGAPGGVGYNMLVRGLTTINNSSPLLVIDGIQTREHLSFLLNPEDIESIQVLKDAASAAIYGTKAANGVIIITTKHGKEGYMNVEFSTQLTYQTIANRLEMLDSYEWGDIYWQASKNDGIIPSHPVYGSGEEPEIPEFIDSSNKQRASNTDWQRLGYRNSLNQNYNISVSSGNKYGSSYLGVNYSDDKGILKGTDFKRIVVKLNTEYKFLNDRLRLGENVNLLKTDEWLAPDGIHELLLIQHPLIPVYTIDGNWGGYVTSLSDMNNPMRLIEQNSQYVNGNWRIFGNMFLEIEPLKNLVLRSAGSVDYRNGWKKFFSPTWREGDRAIDTNSLITHDNYMLEWSWSNTATYNLTINKFSASAVAGIEARVYRTEYVEGKRTDFSMQDPTYFYLNAGSGTQTNANGGTEYATYSQFGKLNLNYDNRYLLAFTLRRDASSRFGKNNGSAFFPAISAGWRLTNEQFMQNVDFINEFKIRASWGRNGNDQIDNEASYSKYYIDNVKAGYDIAGTDNSVWPGVVKTRSANRSLRWEVTTQTNVGFDSEFLNSRLGVSFDVYNKDTDDMLVDRPYIAVIGEGGTYAYNGASMNTQGLEGMVTWKDRVSDFSYEITANFTHSHNVITSLPDDIYYTWGGGNGVDKSIVGHPVGSWFGYVADGLFKTEDSLYNGIDQPGKGLGRIRYADLNHDNVINDMDRDWIGSDNPVLTGGLNLSCSWKNFDFSMFFYGMIRQAWNNSKYYTDFFQLWLGNHGRNLLKAWNPDENFNSDIPALTLKDLNNEARGSTYFIEDGSFWKLKNIQIGYTVPTKVREAVKIKSARVYLSASNIFTLTNYTGLDPEVLGYNYPIPRTFTLGINVGF